MKGNDKKSSYYPYIQEKTFLGWWDRLTDYCWELFKYNLWYLLFTLPPFICMLIFLFFNAYLFLLVAFLLFIPVGPAMLVLHEAAAKIAAGELRTALPHFFYTYKKHYRYGFAFSIVLGIICLVTLYPVYFSFITNSAVKITIMICAGITMLLLCSLLPYIARFLVAGECRGVLKKAIIQALLGGKASFFSGLLQVIWLFICLVYPYVAFFAALLGMPAVIRMTILYIMPQTKEE
ncbi:MAG: hypothetical protein PHG41_00345 [Actinomycetota bacterium]|nr:hypothetical protein [Actinomycetota bacterium]